MSIEGIIAAVGMLIVGIIWLALPILRRRSSVSGEELARQKEREALATTYERMLASLRDVDEDHLTGKLAQQDYESERTYWTTQGVAVLEALEKLGGKKPAKTQKPIPSEPPAIAADPDAMLDDAIEQTIATYIKSTH
ncbi:MAG: hypothetical protein ABI700_02505 [Chloroflexota bacterium]